MRIQPFYDPNLKIDLGRTSDKNPLRIELIRPTHKFTKSVTETSSKVQEFKTYNEGINDPIHENIWCKVIDKELLNLDAYQT